MNYPGNLTAPCRIALALLCTMLAVAPATASHALYDAEGRRLDVEIAPQFSPQSREEVISWTEKLAGSLTLVYGHWPRERWIIEVEATSGSADDPIPWAQIKRGGVDTVKFYVVDNTSAKDLLSEWTGYHEIAHLLLPYRGWGDTWFSEGLATYYQNLLQARAGLISEQEMWQRLYAGFMRGREDSRFDGKSLIEVNRQMRSSGGYMRVYWSGAWYFLAVDIRLRARSNGAFGLDNVLLRLNDCCARDALSVAEMIKVMDSGDQQPVFAELYQSMRNSTRLPDFEPLLAELGITIANGKVVLQSTGKAAQRRRQFLQSTAL
ncbi:hypothetical protein [Pseudohalioglobus lutimaris]|nr:hypothetical protein [Pseudohalioglobus lutimaris]